MSTLALIWWAGCITVLIGTAVLAAIQPFLARRLPVVPAAPVSMVTPIHGAVPWQEAAQAVVAAPGPVDEMLLAARQDDDTAIAAATQFAAGQPFARLVLTSPIAGFNPKTANLIPALAEARHDIVFIRDAGTWLAAGHAGAMAALLAPGVGLVCSAPVARSPQGWVALVEAALINSHGGRMVLAAAALQLPVGIGAAMMFRRSDCDRAGGFALTGPAIADDHALCQLLRGIRLATRFTAETVDQQLGRRTFAAFWRRHLRWALCRRTAEPAAFWLEPLIGLPAAGLAAVLAAGWPGLIFTALLWIATEISLAVLRGWPAGPAMPLAILLREALQPALWLRALFTRSIVWGDVRVPVSRLLVTRP